MGTFLGGAPADRFVSVPTDSYSCIRLDFNAGTATYNIPVPAGCIVMDVITSVGEAFDGTPTITIGDSNSAAGYLQSADIAPATAGTAGTPGINRSRDKARAYSAGKRYPTADNVTVTWTKGTNPTVGTVDICVQFIKYSQFGIPAAVASTATL